MTTHEAKGNGNGARKVNGDMPKKRYFFGRKIPLIGAIRFFEVFPKDIDSSYPWAKKGGDIEYTVAKGKEKIAKYVMKYGLWKGLIIVDEID